VMPAILIFQGVIVLLLAALLLRKNSVTGNAGHLEKLSESALRMQAGLDSFLQAFPAFRKDVSETYAAEARRTREEASGASRELRGEVAGTISSFRSETAESQAQLKRATEDKLEQFSQRLGNFSADQARQNQDLRETLDGKFEKLTRSQAEAQEKLRSTVEARLDAISDLNSKKLEQMRETVDEKLHATLEGRLTESFGLVTEQLGKVQLGLGEMKELAHGVGDLKKLFANVKSRGGIGEVFVGQLLEDMLAPNQYEKNVHIRPNTAEVVEYAIRIPSAASGDMLLPIDSNFPTADWERLQDAYESADADGILSAGKALEAAMRAKGKAICDKYIFPPVTTPYAILYLPTEGLYAEVTRRPGLLADLQSKCRITVAGPNNLMAILSSFQLVFHMVTLQEKGDEVWRVLAGAKSEFGKFGGLMEKVEKQVSTVQNTLQDIGKKTRTINRTLRTVTNVDGSGTQQLLEDVVGFVPALAAGGDEEDDLESESYVP